MAPPRGGAWDRSGAQWEGVLDAVLAVRLRTAPLNQQLNDH